MATVFCNAGLSPKRAAAMAATTFYIALGTGTTAAAKTQTALVAETSATGLTRVAAGTTTAVTTNVANDTIRLTKTFTQGAAGPTVIAEAGVFDAATSGNMWARSLLAVTRSLTLTDQHTIQIDLIDAC